MTLWQSMNKNKNDCNMMLTKFFHELIENLLIDNSRYERGIILMRFPSRKTPSLFCFN